MANAYITGLATCLNILTAWLHNYNHLFCKTQTKKKNREKYLHGNCIYILEMHS